MHRKIAAFEIKHDQVIVIKAKLLNWANQFNNLVYLDNNNYSSIYSRFECLVAVGSIAILQDDGSDYLVQLSKLFQLKKDWIFGHICYEYKDKLESKLFSAKPKKIGFSEISFTIPETVCYINKEQNSFVIESFIEPELVHKQIMECSVLKITILPNLQFNRRVSKEQYIETVEKIRNHIALGDCYELNYCNEGYSENANIIPISVFRALNSVSPAPFAAFYRKEDKYMMCASPERYLRKQGKKILSQPIKGTAPRNNNLDIDLQNKSNLQNSIKEQAENVMIVDLVRNDLARCCKTGSIEVEELFGIYTFPQVHQMISTVSGILKDGSDFVDAIKYSFPMGSMTGAPKHKVMQLIETYELTRRELFSGAIGYIMPNGDFDFNVIIRSLFYNSSTKYLSYNTGGAITFDSKPDQEWDEMLLKAMALESIFVENG